MAYIIFLEYSEWICHEPSTDSCWKHAYCYSKSCKIHTLLSLFSFLQFDRVKIIFFLVLRLSCCLNSCNVINTTSGAKYSKFHSSWTHFLTPSTCCSCCFSRSSGADILTIFCFSGYDYNY